MEDFEGFRIAGRTFCLLIKKEMDIITKGKFMKDEINKIRELLDKIESSKEDEADKSFKESFELFELPEIVNSIVDYLQPLLQPYEAVIYWYMLRHSITETGDVYVRTSTNILRKAKTVIISSSG